MKNIIGHAKCTNNKFRPYTIYCYLHKEVRNILNCESIVFNPDTLVFRRAGIDDRKVHSVAGSLFTFTPIREDASQFLGNYKVVQEDEDTFYLKKIKDGVT